jgi:hypothetical protein
MGDAMSISTPGISGLVHGRLFTSGNWPLILEARWCNVRPAFIPKGQVGRHYRAISRSGRILLASDRSLAELAGRLVRVRLQTWHKVILPGTRAEPYGILLCVQEISAPGPGPYYEATLGEPGDDNADLSLEVGALRVLEFRLEHEPFGHCLGGQSKK